VRLLDPRQEKIIVLLALRGVLSGDNLFDDFFRNLDVSDLALILNPFPIFADLIDSQVRVIRGNKHVRIKEV
jgi:hypothetical protein